MLSKVLHLVDQQDLNFSQMVQKLEQSKRHIDSQCKTSIKDFVDPGNATLTLL